MKRQVDQKKTVLFLCTGNSARSQMAEGLLRHFAGDHFEVASAGTQPMGLNPVAIRVMQEVGADISAHRSKRVEEFIGKRFDYIVTVCDRAKESCPIFPGPTVTLHWSFEDPAAIQGGEEVRLTAFRKVRDSIATRLRHFLAELAHSPPARWASEAPAKVETYDEEGAR